MEHGRPEQLPWDSLRRGVGLLLGIVLVLGLVFFSDLLRRELSEGPQLLLATREVAGLIPGADVWLAGRRVGRVTGVSLRPADAPDSARVVVRAVLNRGVGGYLRADVTARIRGSSFLGPPVLALDPGNGRAPPFDFSDTLQAAQSLDREAILGRADSLRRRLNELRPEAKELAARLAGGDGTLGLFAAHPELGRELRGRGRELRRLTAGDSGSLGRLLADSSLSARLARVRENGERLERRLGSGDARRAVTRLRGQAEELASRLAALQRRLAEGRGTAGRVLNDRALQQQTDLLRARVDSARAELLADPLRWLRFRLF